MTTIDQVIDRANGSASSSKFFSPETMRWWGTRTLSETADAPGGAVLFVTSDDPFHTGRRYTVRIIDAAGEVTSVTEPHESKTAVMSAMRGTAAAMRSGEVEGPFAVGPKLLQAHLDGVEARRK